VITGAAERTRPGGAALAALLAARDGRTVVLVAAPGTGPAADTLRHLLAPHVRVVEVPRDGDTPEKIRVMDGDRTLVRVDRDTPGRCGAPGLDVADTVSSAGCVLVSDYGRGLLRRREIQDLIAAQVGRVPVVWDPHPRGTTPAPGTTLVTPNRDEAALASGVTIPRDGPATLARAAEAARILRDRWRAGAVCVTLGPRGAVLGRGAEPFTAPAPPAAATDVCGAGDRFAATVATVLADGSPAPEAVTAGVRAAAAFVGSGGASGLARDGRPPAGAADTVVEAVRARGGTVVATGGCFDLLHAGHVETLAAARALGDCLVVCVNSDASVRALKGDPRPYRPLADRVAVLASLACVDAVEVFDDLTPERVLARLRPDIWVKGGDYSADQLPEAALLATWGGQAVTVPYLAGRSTTAVARAVLDGAA
jgi:rfaE bifunctional protein nucleotidyltransferase chain/domain